MPKVILISGGSDGLGKAIAEKLSPNNQVIILAHNRAKLESAAKEIHCDFVEAEMTEYFSLESAVKQVIQKYQKIDVLINNAGLWMEGDIEENDPQKIKDLIAVNTTGTIFLTKAVIGDMRSHKSGQIINIISQDGLCAKKSRSIYHASKWAITGFTRCLQEDLAEESIKVTGVYPGLIKTKLFEKSGALRDLSDALEPSEVASIIENVINLNPSTHIPEICIKNKQNQTPNMDDTNAPTIDLNIDPNMIAPQNDSPQMVPTSPTPPAPTAGNSGIIDITPGSTDVLPTSTPPTPATPVSENTLTSHLSAPSPVQPANPAPIATPVAPIPQAPTFTATPVSPTPNPTPVESAPQAPAPTATPVQPVPATQSTSVSEDPDLVKLVK